MNNIGSPPSKRMRLSGEELSKISKDEIIQLYIKQQDELTELQAKTVDVEKETGEKSKIAETSRRENVLVMRLATKEQELQQYAAQIAHIKKSQEDIAAKSLREALLDPAVNLLFDKMRDELKETKDKLEQAQSELGAWKFTPDSQTGKKLMSRCRTLIAENQDLGRQLSQGQVAKLEAELALQKQYTEDLKKSQEELNEFVIQLDEEVEGMQSTIQILQQQLNESRAEVEKYKKLGRDVDYEDESRTKSGTKDSSDRELPKAIADNRKTKGEGNIVKLEPEVGHSDKNATKSEKPLDERNFENAVYICKEECNFDGEHNVYDSEMHNESPSEAGHVKSDSGYKDVGSETPTYSEHEIIDESQDSSPELTPERDSLLTSNRVEISGGKEGERLTKIESPGNDDLSPMNDGEMYAVIDNGSDDDVERVANVVNTNDEPMLDNTNANNAVLSNRAPKTPDGEFIDPSERDETLDYDENMKDEDEENTSPIEDENTMQQDVQETAETIDANPETKNVEAIEKNSSSNQDDHENGVNQLSPTQEGQQVTTVDEEETANGPSVRPETPEVQQPAVPSSSATTIEKPSVPVAPVTTTVSDSNIESAVKTTTISTPNMMSLADSKPELQLPPVNGPQAAISTIAHPLMQPAQVPIMGDPTAYLMSPHFQHLSGASAALAQQQAILAEQALIYKSMLAQQQRQHLAASEDKTIPSDGAEAAKTAEVMRTPGVNPIVPGLPFADPSTAAILAQYKAMLTARSMFVPGPDGKTQQVIAPGGLGLYPGLPLVQPPVLTQPQGNEHGAPNSVPASWPASTNVTYTPHPLMTQGFLATNPTPGMMVYAGHNVTPQTVAAHPAAAEMEKHHGSGDHRAIPNGLPLQKGQDSSDTNPSKEEPQVVM